MKKIAIACVSLLLFAQCREGEKKAEGAAESAPAAVEEASQNQAEAARGFALETQAALGKTLQAQIARQGTTGAIGFCNLNALPITDSVAKARGVKIGRITDRPRNPANRATAAEAGLMARVRDSLAKGVASGSLALAENGETHYYFPIVTNNLCLQCHGVSGQDVAPEVGARLAALYPDDQAMGYGPNELRGLWKVTPNPGNQ
jgi:hypothetical protein